MGGVRLVIHFTDEKSSTRCYHCISDAGYNIKNRSCKWVTSDLITVATTMIISTLWLESGVCGPGTKYGVDLFGNISTAWPPES